MSLKVNGQTYGWGDVDVKIPGLVLVVQEISYDDEQEMEESYGKGYRPRGYGKGNYKASGKMSMLRDDYDDVLAYCKAKGIPFYGIEWPSVVVSYANEGERTRIDELKKVIPTKRSHKAAQGDKSLTVDIDLMIVGGIVEDGVEPTKERRYLKIIENRRTKHYGRHEEGSRGQEPRRGNEREIRQGLPRRRDDRGR